MTRTKSITFAIGYWRVLLTTPEYANNMLSKEIRIHTHNTDHGFITSGIYTISELVVYCSFHLATVSEDYTRFP